MSLSLRSTGNLPVQPWAQRGHGLVARATRTRKERPMKARLVFAGVSLLSICFVTRANAAPFQPTFDPNNFTPGAAIDNPYLPFPVGTTYIETATVTDPDTGDTGFEID